MPDSNLASIPARCDLVGKPGRSRSSEVAQSWKSLPQLLVSGAETQLERTRPSPSREPEQQTSQYGEPQLETKIAQGKVGRTVVDLGPRCSDAEAQAPKTPSPFGVAHLLGLTTTTAHHHQPAPRGQRSQGPQ